MLFQVTVCWLVVVEMVADMVVWVDRCCSMKSLDDSSILDYMCWSMGYFVVYCPQKMLNLSVRYRTAHWNGPLHKITGSRLSVNGISC